MAALVDSPIEHLSQGLAAQQAGEMLKAKKHYWQCLKSDIYQPDALFYNALAAYESEQFYEADLLAEATLRQQPDFEEGWALRGLAQWRLGNLDTAQQCFNTLLQFNPASVDAHVGMARVSLGKKDYVTALNLCRRGRKQYPGGDVEFILTIALILSEAGKPERACFYYSALLNAVPNHYQVRIHYAKTLLGLGRAKECLAVLAPLFKNRENLSPQQMSVIYECMIRCYLLEDNFNMAIQCRRFANKLTV